MNHAANGPEPLPVVQAVQRYLQACSEAGTVMEQDWKDVPSAIRNNVARLFNCPSTNIAFLPNVSAAVNIVAGGVTWAPGDNVVVTQDQFPANVYPWMFLQTQGVEVRFVDWHRDGFTQAITDAVDDRTRVVAVSWVEFFSGHRHSLADIGILCKEKDIIFVVDAIQGIGVVPFYLQDVEADVVAVGGHKWLLGPDGQGAAYFSTKLLDRLNPNVYSWRSIDDFMNFDSFRLDLKAGADRFESGTQNWAGVIGFGAAIEIILEIGLDNISKSVRHLTELSLEYSQELPVEILTPMNWEQRAGIVSIRPPINAEDVRMKLLNRGIVCSARRDALRISPHFYNTPEEIQQLFACLKDVM